jgi:hypothetical protein
VKDYPLQKYREMLGKHLPARPCRAVVDVEGRHYCGEPGTQTVRGTVFCDRHAKDAGE